MESLPKEETTQKAGTNYTIVGDTSSYGTPIEARNITEGLKCTGRRNLRLEKADEMKSEPGAGDPIPQGNFLLGEESMQAAGIIGLAEEDALSGVEVNGAREPREGSKRTKNGNARRRRQGRMKFEPKPERKVKVKPEVLLAQAEALLGEGRPEDARLLAIQAFEATELMALPAVNLLATIALESGNSEEARSHFLRAVALDPDGMRSEEEGGGAEKFFWLAQLSEEGGHDSVIWFEKGAGVLKNHLIRTGHRLPEPDEKDINGTTNSNAEQHTSEEVKSALSKIASALCGIVEIYMTDLSCVFAHHSLSFSLNYIATDTPILVSNLMPKPPAPASSKKR